jgi:hypothetical protein
MFRAWVLLAFSSGVVCKLRLRCVDDKLEAFDTVVAAALELCSHTLNWMS